MKMMEILRFQKKLHPYMKVQDIVKFVYQVSFGPVHLLEDRISFYHTFTREYSFTKILSTPLYFMEQLFEEMDPEGKWVRLNLRKAAKYLKAEDIFYIVLLSIEEENKEKEDKFNKLCEELKIEKKDVSHHSKSFKREKPLYIVVKKEHLLKLIGLVYE